MKAFLAILILSASATFAWAHGDAAWIMKDSRYKRVSGVHCCNVRDCRELPDGAVKVTPTGYLIVALNHTVPYNWPALYQSINEKFWMCEEGGRVHCFFPPVAGS